MRGQDDAVACVALRAVHGLGDTAIRRLVSQLGGVAAVLGASDAELIAAGLAAPTARRVREVSLDDARAEVARVAAVGARVVPWGGAEYPAPLRELPDAPLYLVVRGEALEADPTIAIVGARHATPYGLEIAARFGEELAQAGVAVVSGLARGVDAAAHRGALRGGGQTMAVLGCGIDVVYPPEHAALAAEIVAAGALVSELPVGAPPLAKYFPARNRIIAGIAHGTLVVEAAEHSGSQITARLALDQGREVLAVPGRIDSPLSVGAHRLIQQGAKLVTTVDDILSEIVPALRARGMTAPSRVDARFNEEPLVPLLAAGPLAADELIRRSGLPPAQVLTRVLELELNGVLVQLPGKQFQLATRS